MNIIICIHSFNLNGVTKSTISFIRFLIQASVDIRFTISSPSDGAARSLFDKLGAYTIISQSKGQLLQSLKDQKIIPDLIIRESIFSLDVKDIAQEFQARYYIRIHDMLPIDRVSNNWFTECKPTSEYFKEMENCNVIFVGKKVRSHYSVLSEKFKLRVFTCPPATCEEDVSLAKIDHLPKGFRILQLGTIYPRKGTHLTIEAFKYFLKKYTPHHCHLILIGERNADQKERQYTKRIREQIENSGLKKNIHILPSTPEPFSLISDYNILTLHSLSECSPLVIYESFLLGKPVISSNVGAIPEQVNLQKLGQLFSYQDIVKQGDLFHEAYKDSKDPRSKDHSREISDHYHQNYSSDHLNNLLCKIYEII